MSFNAIFEQVYALLYNDPSLVPGILGARVPSNMRILRASPQTMHLLSTYEPNQPAEGWVVIEEPLPAQRSRNNQAQTNHEYLSLNFHAFGTTYAVTHQVLDVLDTFFHWSVMQQRDVVWGNRFLLFTRRSHEVDLYEQASKMYHKLISFYLEFVLEEDAA